MKNGYPKLGDVPKWLHWQNLARTHSFRPVTVLSHYTVPALSCLNESCYREYQIELMSYSPKTKQVSDAAAAHATKLLLWPYTSKTVSSPSWRLELCASTDSRLWCRVAYWLFVETSKVHGAMVCEYHRIIVEKPPVLGPCGSVPGASRATDFHKVQFWHQPCSIYTYTPANNFMLQVHLCRRHFLHCPSPLLKSSVHFQQT